MVAAVIPCVLILVPSSGTWRSTIKQWASLSGVTIPIQAVYDVVGNLFNVQVRPGQGLGFTFW